MNENLKPMIEKEPNLSNVNLSQEPNIDLNKIDMDGEAILRRNAETIRNADKYAAR